MDMMEMTYRPTPSAGAWARSLDLLCWRCRASAMARRLSS